MLFDTHVHFDKLHGDELAGVIQRARKAGVGRILAVGSSQEGNRHALQVAAEYPEMVAAALGYDRDEAEAFSGDPKGIAGFVSGLKSEIQKAVDGGTPVVAVGETGLDFHYSADTSEAQILLLKEQLAMAHELELPVIVHSREADAATLVELSRHAEQWGGSPDRIGVLHCFTGGKAFAEEVLELGFHLSFSGIVTFPKAEALRDVVAGIPEGRLLIETDTPYLAPVPHRGKRNEPAFVGRVAEALADIRGQSVDAMAAATQANAARLFGTGV